jgi:hypothetical protein
MSIYVTAFWVWLAFAGLAGVWFAVVSVVELVKARKGGKR